MNTIKNLNWNERFALINHYNPNDQTICDTFNVTLQELNTARNMMKTGTFAVVDDMDFSQFPNIFVSPVKRGESKNKPLTATKKVSTPKKRGRKGTNIAKAFEIIPNSAILLSKFAQDNNVSEAVLKQNKRFDKFPEKGDVKVRKDKDTGEMMIWRENPTDI